MTITNRTERRAAFVRQVFLLCGLVALLAAGIGYVRIHKRLPASLTRERHLAENVGRIMTLDEVLTMSARLAASTGDSAYHRRYLANVDKLDHLIKDTVGLVPNDEVSAAVRSTDLANQRLVDMETRSFDLDKASRYDEALRLLESTAYQADKAAYAEGMRRAFALLQRLTAADTASVDRWGMIFQIACFLSLAMVLTALILEQSARREQVARRAVELEATVAGRTSELAQRNRAMRLVLDSVQQGLVGVDLSGWMSSERSAILDRWFGSPPECAKLSDHVRASDAAFASWFDLGLDQLREGLLPFEICIDQFPKRLRLGERTLSVGYERVQTDGRFEGLLVVMTDITIEIERERAETAQRDLLRIVGCLGRDRPGFLSFLEGTDLAVGELSGSTPPPLAEAVRLIHTLKGDTAQFGLSVVSRVCHELEERLVAECELTPEDRSRLQTTWRETKELIETVVGNRGRNHLEIDKAEYDSVLELVRRRCDHDEILDALSAWALDPVQARLERLAEYARVLANQLAKPEIEIQCDAHGLRVDGTQWGSFWSSCVHLVRNAVDHGIEQRAARTAIAKGPGGHLTLSAEKAQGRFVVRVCDDGAGIDWGRLVQKGAAQGRRAETEEQRAELLFESGMSTTDKVTEISGRGVGLGAVREEVRRRGGVIVVASQPGLGTTVEMRFPIEAMTGPPRSSPQWVS